jgi:hypothetical protein
MEYASATTSEDGVDNWTACVAGAARIGSALRRPPSPTLGSLYNFRQLANFTNYSVRQPSYFQQLTIGTAIAIREACGCRTGNNAATR